MNVKRRWMKWIIEEADRLEATMPWDRTTDRGAWRRRIKPDRRLWLVVNE